MLTQSIIAIILHPMGPVLFFKAQTSFSKDAFLGYLQYWDNAQLMGQYRLHFYFDFALPLFYAVFGSSLLALGLNLNNSQERWNRLLVLPFIAALMDYIENFFHMIFIADFNTITSQKVFFSALVCNTKWVLVGLFSFAAIILYSQYFIGKGKNES